MCVATICFSSRDLWESAFLFAGISTPILFFFVTHGVDVRFLLWNYFLLLVIPKKQSLSSPVCPPHHSPSQFPRASKDMCCAADIPAVAANAGCGIYFFLASDTTRSSQSRCIGTLQSNQDTSSLHWIQKSFFAF